MPKAPACRGWPVAYNLRLDAHQNRPIAMAGRLLCVPGGQGPGQKLDAQTGPGGLLPDAAGSINSIAEDLDCLAVPHRVISKALVLGRRVREDQRN